MSTCFTMRHFDQYYSQWTTWHVSPVLQLCSALWPLYGYYEFYLEAIPSSEMCSLWRVMRWDNSIQERECTESKVQQYFWQIQQFNSTAGKLFCVCQNCEYLHVLDLRATGHLAGRFFFFKLRHPNTHAAAISLHALLIFCRTTQRPKGLIKSQIIKDQLKFLSFFPLCDNVKTTDF